MGDENTIQQGPLIRSENSDANENVNVAEKYTSHPLKLFGPHTKSPSELKVWKLGWN